jgi:two-component system nitrate/nitrite sensor histidine kinase NarX
MAQSPKRSVPRDLGRLKWATLVVPVVFVWLFELARWLFLDRTVSGDDAHVLAAMMMAGAIVVFATIVSIYLDRTQRQLVAQNNDLTAMHAVSGAVRGGLELSALLDQSLDEVMRETGALAGRLVVHRPDAPQLDARRPAELAPGMQWLGPILDEDTDPALFAPRSTRRTGLDTDLLDVPLLRGTDRVGSLRLVFHPPEPPAISESALLDIAGEIAGAAQLGLFVADLDRRQRERAALYEVALQLTGRASLSDVLDTITRHARELLGADRAVACLGDARDLPGRSNGLGRIAIADDGSTVELEHPVTSAIHNRNADCPLIERDDRRAWAAHSLRGPDGVLGELCVIRAGTPFTPAERDLLGAFADMAAIAVRTARLHEAEEQWTIHAERDRIARELHDSLAQVLGVIHLRLRALEGRAADEASVSIAGELSEIADTADEAYRDVREAILGLRETVRDDDGLEGSLREYLRKYTRQTGIAATVTCEGDTRRALTPRSEVQLLRVVQEALANTRKHSGAHKVAIRIECDGPRATVAIEDDGRGFDPARVAGSMEGGFGLASMRERVELIGGTLDVQTAPGNGTRIVVRLQAEDSRGTPSPQAQGAPGR